MAEEIFKAAINKIWLSANSWDQPVEDYEEDRKARRVSFKLPGEEVEFDKLELLAKILDTKQINFRKISVQTGYCETCWTVDRKVTIDCDNVTFESDECHNCSKYIHAVIDGYGGFCSRACYDKYSDQHTQITELPEEDTYDR